MGYTIKIGQASMEVPTQQDIDDYGSTTIDVVIQNEIGRIDPSYTSWTMFCKQVGIKFRESNFHFREATRLLRQQDLDFLNSIQIDGLEPYNQRRVEWLRETVKKALETCSIPAISFD